MDRSLLASLGNCQPTIITSLKSRWTPFVLLIPVAAYVLFRLFEEEATTFVIPLFPDEADKSRGFYNDMLHLWFNEMLWWSGFLLLSWLFIFKIPVSGTIRHVGSIISKHLSVYIAALAALTIVSAVMITQFALDAFPNSADEYVYLYQAQTLGEGMLVQTAHPLEEFFHFNHIAQKEGVSVGRFPPGWPLLLSLSHTLNFGAWWINPMLGALALILFFSFAKESYGKQVAIWSTFTLAFTGYFIFNNASYFSHTSCLLFTVGFVYCLYRSDKRTSILYPLLAGFCLGFIVLIRYYTAVLFFIPVVVSMLYHHGWKSFRILVLIGVGALPAMLFLLWYNYEITGNPFLPVTMWADDTEALGFVKGHTITRAFEHTIRRILLFLYWCSPAVLILYVIHLIRKVLNRAERFVHPEDYFFIVLLCGYFFYHHLGGNQYGPRFLFEALPFAIVLVVNKALYARGSWQASLLAAGMIYAIAKLPYIIEREHRVVEERTDLYARVEEAALTNALVFVSTHTGVIRPMPVRDLTRNDMNYRNDVIYAEDRGDENKALMEFYPERKYYRYVRDRERVGGRLLATGCW